MNRNQKPEPKTPPKKPWSVPPKLQEAAKDTLARARVEAIISPNVPLDTFNLVTVSEAVQLLAQHRNHEQLRMNAMGLPAAAAAEHADNFWRQSLPDLADKHSVLIYLACVAWGMRCRILRPDEAKLMIFLAQTQLTVFKMDVPGPLQSGALRAPERPEIPDAQLTLLPDRASEDSHAD
jgi:hypothetical protein